jgi:hypothetical protein
MLQTSTRYGRIIRAPKNEYTDRVYVAGSGFIGADHYDQSFIGGRETALGLAAEMAAEEETQNSHNDEMNDFIVDDEFEEIPLDDSCDEEDELCEETDTSDSEDDEHECYEESDDEEE